jgi:phage terminase large subunit
LVVLNPKYQPLITNNTRYFILTGGRGSAKSFAVGTFASALSFEPGHKILFTRQTMASAHLSIIPEFEEKINLLNAQLLFEVNKSEVRNTQSGSEIIFRGIKTSSGDQSANLKSLQGVTTWIVDEAEELVDENIFDKINLSVRQKGKQNRVILILNPATKEHWIYKRFFEDTGIEPGWNGQKDNVTYIYTDYRDNIDNLDEVYVDEIKQLEIKNPSKYKHQILGGWLDKAEGVIFTNWEIAPFQEINKSVFGQDFGFSIDPTTLIETSIDNNNKRIYIKELLYKPRMTTSDIYAENLLSAGKSLIIADSAEPRLISELKDKGNNIVPTFKGPGSITAGYAVLMDYRLIIDPCSINTIKELNNHVWHDKKSSTPVDDYNHSLDAIRYAVYGQLVNKPVTPGRLSL